MVKLACLFPKTSLLLRINLFQSLILHAEVFQAEYLLRLNI